MKILLTTLLLIASPISLGATSVPLITKEGCKVNLEKFNTINSASWTGKCKGGAVDGVGVMKLTIGDRTLKIIQEYYDGEWASPGYFMDNKSIVLTENAGHIIPLKACKLSGDCDFLYTTAVKNGLFKVANNSGLSGVADFFNRARPEVLAEFESNFDSNDTSTLKTKKTSYASGTADGLQFSMQNGSIVANGGPCTGPGLYKVSVGERAFEQVKNGTFRDQYYLDGVMHSNKNLDVHIALSPDTNWTETVQQNRKEANDLRPGDPEKPDAEKEADVAECLARSQKQYAIAFENWMKANMHLCKECAEVAKSKKTYSKNPNSNKQCTKFVSTTDTDTSGTKTRQWEIRPDVKANPQALGELLEFLKSIRDCDRCGGAPEEIVAMSKDSFISLASESLIDEKPYLQQYSAIPFIKMVSCELGMNYQ